MAQHFTFRSSTFLFTLLLLSQFSARGQEPAPVYPRIAGYAGILHPIVSFSSDGTDANFDGHYVVGMPVGINIWKTPKVGFSAEFVPSIRLENGISRMNNFTFHPGILLSLSKGFTFAGRAAFETSGRFGFTPVINKIVIRKKTHGYFIAVPLPVRFGNDRPASFTPGFQFGIAF
jgi:hypothetical protein